MVVNTTQPDQDTWVIGFSGKLNFESRNAFHGGMAKVEQTSPRHIILDFTDLTYIDSAGLGLLTLAHRKLSAISSRLVIANPQSAVRDILLLTNIDKMFSIVDSVAVPSPRHKAPVFPHS